MVKDVLQIGDARLKAECKDVELNHIEHELIADLKDTINSTGLIGIAAPQIGSHVNLFVTEIKETATRGKDEIDVFRVYINPKIIESSDSKIIIYEGCGSVLNGKLFGPVERPEWVVVEAYDANGKVFRVKANGILGRVIQHEYDHLFGIEFLEKIKDYKQLMTSQHYIEQIKGEEWHKNNSKITLKEVS